MLQQALKSTAILEMQARELDDQMEDAIRTENYAVAARAKQELNELAAQDIVGTLIEASSCSVGRDVEGR